MVMDVSVEVGEALTEAFRLAVTHHHAEVEPGHVVLGIAKRHSSARGIDMLMSSVQADFFREISIMQSSGRQLLPSSELCTVLASAMRPSDSGYLSTRDLLNCLAAVTNRKVAENAKKLLRDLPLTSNIRESEPDDKLRQFLEDVDANRQRTVIALQGQDRTPSQVTQANGPFLVDRDNNGHQAQGTRNRSHRSGSKKPPSVRSTRINLRKPQGLFGARSRFEGTRRSHRIAQGLRPESRPLARSGRACGRGYTIYRRYRSCGDGTSRWSGSTANSR